MATTTTTNPPCTPAPWRDAFITHISSMKQTTFVLSTLHPVSASSSSLESGFSVVPRARTCVYRGLWAEMPANDKNTAPRNLAVFESDLPVFTTDARMEKAGEVISTAPLSRKPGQSGGGGPVEAVWWAEEHGMQWRVRGTAWVLGNDIDSDADGAKAVREALQARMRKTGEAEEKWSWRRELTAHFGNLSPVMRGTFRNPAPGTPISTPVPPESGLGLGQTVDDVEDQVARENFRVVVILPTEIDQVDLSDMKKARRWLYVYRGASYLTTHPGGEVIGEWEKVEVFP